jgi:cephalosporin-C deacetylase-like acetyl esterase
MLRLIGGLPETRGPLNVKPAGVIRHPDYRIEKVVYESLPGFYVTANVYVPEQGGGPFPAILTPVGHGAAGKAGEREVAVGLVKKGFIVLKYDPIGQGERLQYYDPDLRASRAGGPTDEHSHANGHTMVVGENVARYRIWDGMRGIDYLVSRKDVDAGRIGCTGCSGGGTLTTYISALDDRVKVAAPSCYMNSWQELLNSVGPQDAEQSWPRFLAEGLDIADFVELFAPKPWLMVSTIQDFFPLEGARQTYEEARRIYGLYQATDRIAWHVGPGPHGVPRPSREAIYEWFVKWLRNGQGDRNEPAIDLDPAGDLLVTPTGQVSDSLGGETVFTLSRKRAQTLIAARPRLDAARLAEEVRRLAAISAEPGGPVPALETHETFEREGYRLHLVSFETAKGIRIPGLLAAPEGPGPKPAALLADARAKSAQAAAGGDLDSLARAGYIVLSIQPRGLPENPRPAEGLVDSQTVSALAAVTGNTLPGMRAEDIIRAVDLLAARSDVDRARITAAARGILGPPLLHAAVLDRRIARVIVADSLASYRAVSERPMHRDFYDVALHGVLAHYDLDDLIAALAPRPVIVLNPVDPAGVPLRPADFRRYAPRVPESVRVFERSRRETLAALMR